jgi:hypothetical protein
MKGLILRTEEISRDTHGLFRVARLLLNHYDHSDHSE